MDYHDADPNSTGTDVAGHLELIAAKDQIVRRPVEQQHVIDCNTRAPDSGTDYSDSMRDVMKMQLQVLLLV